VGARFKGGPILRKRLSATADAALSCWGWFITPTQLQVGVSPESLDFVLLWYYGPRQRWTPRALFDVNEQQRTGKKGSRSRVSNSAQPFST